MKTIGFSNAGTVDDYADAKEKVLGSLREHFRPEFLNRLDEIVMFDILSPEAIRKIVDIQIGIVRKRLLEKQIALDVSDVALTFLGEKGYNPQYGARPLKRLIQDKILTNVANLMISQGIGDGGVIAVDVKDGELFIAATNKGKRQVKHKNISSKTREKAVA